MVSWSLMAITVMTLVCGFPHQRAHALAWPFTEAEDSLPLLRHAGELSLVPDQLADLEIDTVVWILATMTPETTRRDHITCYDSKLSVMAATVEEERVTAQGNVYDTSVLTPHYRGLQESDHHERIYWDCIIRQEVCFVPNQAIPGQHPDRIEENVKMTMSSPREHVEDTISWVIHSEVSSSANVFTYYILFTQSAQHAELKLDDNEENILWYWTYYSAEMHSNSSAWRVNSSTQEEETEAIFSHYPQYQRYVIPGFQPPVHRGGTEEYQKMNGWVWRSEMGPKQGSNTTLTSIYRQSIERLLSLYHGLTKAAGDIFCTSKKTYGKHGRLVRGRVETNLLRNFGISSILLICALLRDEERKQRLRSMLASACDCASLSSIIGTAFAGQSDIHKWESDFKGHTPLWKTVDTYIPRSVVSWVVAPATSFLPAIGSSPEDTMAHLGCRLASLAALPASCDVSRTRLAQAGFYFDNSKDDRNASNVHEVVCFSCGITVAKWEPGDNPMVVHRRLKPDCPYILSQGPDVFPSDAAQPYPRSGTSSISSLSTLSTDSSLSSLSSSMSSWSSSSSISSDSSQASVFGGTAAHDGARSGGYSDLATDCAAIAPSPLPPNHVTTPASQYAPSRPAHSNFPARSSRNPGFYDDSDDRPELSLDSAVYPQFSTMSERLATFQGWPLGAYFKPEDLVYDGFYYAGYADCVRCYYCGVGLKSWDRNDSVMDEHIRWRPTCGYILAVKGRRFVNQTLQRLRAQAPEEDSELSGSQTPRNSVDGVRNGPAVPSLPHTSNGSSQGGNSSQGDNSLDSAIQAVREMGFSDDIIARARNDLQQPGMATICKETFIEYVMSLPPVHGPATQTNTSGTNGASDLHTDGPSADEAAPLNNRAQEVIRENERLRSMRTCKVCNRGTVGVIFLPCGHLVACTDCAGQTRNCTRCGQYIRATANVYLS